MGRVCRAYRGHPFHGLPLSQELVAGWLGITQAQLSRIETGSPIRDLDKLIHWARTLRIPPHELWFDLPGVRRHGHQATSRTDDHSRQPACLVDELRTVPVGTRPGRNGAAHGVGSDVAAIQSFRAADRQVGGGHMYATVIDYLRTGIGPRLLEPVGNAHGPVAFCAAAALTEMAGWMAHDAGQQALAQQHFVRAFDLVKVGGDQHLAAHILASMSHLANHLDRPSEAVLLARAGQAEVRSGPCNPGLEARLYAMEAGGLAALQEPVDCARALGCADKALNRIPSSEPSEWISCFDEASLAIEAARCLRRLGQIARARGEAERVVALRPGDRARSRAFGQLTLAAILIEQGNPEEACAVGYEVLNGTRALSSFLVVQQLRGLGQLLEPYRSIKAVSDFLACLVEELRRRMWLYDWFSANSRVQTAGG